MEEKVEMEKNKKEVEKEVEEKVEMFCFLVNKKRRREKSVSRASGTYVLKPIGGVLAGPIWAVVLEETSASERKIIFKVGASAAFVSF